MAKKEIENYIEKSLKKGYSATKIKKNLVAVGHKLEHIEHALAVVQERLETEASEEESSARLRRKLWMQIGIAYGFPPEFCLELTGTPAAHCYANLQS